MHRSPDAVTYDDHPVRAFRSARRRSSLITSATTTNAASVRSRGVIGLRTVAATTCAAYPALAGAVPAASAASGVATRDAVELIIR